jgi:hypothetical protein
MIIIALALTASFAYFWLQIIVRMPTGWFWKSVGKSPVTTKVFKLIKTTGG